MLIIGTTSGGAIASRSRNSLQDNNVTRRLGAAIRFTLQALSLTGKNGATGGGNVTPTSSAKGGVLRVSFSKRRKTQCQFCSGDNTTRGFSVECRIAGE